METWVEMLIEGVLLIVASTGFWTFIQHRRNHKDAKNKLLIGLAHDRLMYLGGVYVQRGYITKDEYENFHTYLYKPYTEAGGNGSVTRMMIEVDKLPLCDPVHLTDPSKKKEKEHDKD